MPLLNKSFTHIYIEEGVLHHPKTEQICSVFPSAVIIPVSNYKEIFNRPGQNYRAQAGCRSLILAEKKDGLIYQGSVMCHDFDQEWFYYCTNVLNCIYDCEYCWLKGMYQTANLVIFVNTEDFLEEAERMLQKHPMYLCLSYENDLVPLERITGILGEWASFTLGHPDLLIEIRTKCADRRIWQTLPVCDRIIPAFTLSPQKIIETAEHGTSSLAERIRAVNAAAEAGFRPRLCFDPVFAVPGWEELYGETVRTVMESTDPARIRDVSIGTFRLSRDYLRNMRRAFPRSRTVHDLYELKDGYYGYGKEKERRIIRRMKEFLGEYISPEQIYTLEGSDE
jgi:spore photoproduct lyase